LFWLQTTKVSTFVLFKQDLLFCSSFVLDTEQRLDDILSNVCILTMFCVVSYSLNFVSILTSFKSWTW